MKPCGYERLDVATNDRTLAIPRPDHAYYGSKISPSGGICTVGTVGGGGKLFRVLSSVLMGIVVDASAHTRFWTYDNQDLPGPPKIVMGIPTLRVKPEPDALTCACVRPRIRLQFFDFSCVFVGESWP